MKKNSRTRVNHENKSTQKLAYRPTLYRTLSTFLYVVFPWIEGSTWGGVSQTELF